MSTKQWWETFFDDDYFRIWGQLLTEESRGKQAAALWSMLDLNPGCRILDAPCGWGRLSRALAELGANVVGVDQSESLLDIANRNWGELPAERLHYVKRDLRTQLSETGFDVACNILRRLVMEQPRRISPSFGPCGARSGRADDWPSWPCGMSE